MGEMERRAPFPPGRPALPAAVLTLVLAIIAAADHAGAAGGNKRTVVAPGQVWDGWPTQDWPQGGQDCDQPRFIDQPFTRAMYRSSSGAILAADPSPYPQWGGGGTQVMGEVATAWVAGLSAIGPYSVAVAVLEDGIVAFPSPAAWQNYGAAKQITEPGGYEEFVGTPVVVGSEEVSVSGRDTTGYYTVYAVANATNAGVIAQPAMMRLDMRTVYSAGTKGSSLYTTMDSYGYWNYATAAKAPYGPTLGSTGLLYLATRGYPYDEYLAGKIYEIIPEILWPIYEAEFQIGAGWRQGVPKGQEPPAASERYGATTPIAASGDLVVVGCQGLSEDTWLGPQYALFGYNVPGLTLRWMVKVDSQIMPTPVILGSAVIFGTASGRAYAVNAYDGTFYWQTPYADRIRYQTNPFNSLEDKADCALYGPAIDPTGEVAYFGGSDGGITVMAVENGTVLASTGSLLLYASQRSWGYELDANGRVMLRPLTMSCAPVMVGNAIVFKLNTLNYGTGKNGSFLLSIGGTEGSGYMPAPYVYLSGQMGSFILGTDPVNFVGMNGSYIDFIGFDIIRQQQYVNQPGYGYYVAEGIEGYENDTGGLSAGSGYFFATDRAGHIAMIPAFESYTAPPSGGVSSGFVPPHPGTPDPLPPALGPIEVYPNPFDPAKAVGHVAKFTNLPGGSWVELYTLAYERVRVITQVNNRAEWDGTNEAGQPVATGVYLYRIVLPGDVPPVTGRLALVRR